MHTAGRTFIGRTERDSSLNTILDVLHEQRRRQRIGEPDERAVIKEGVPAIITRFHTLEFSPSSGRLGKPLVCQTGWQLPQQFTEGSAASAARLSSSALAVVRDNRSIISRSPAASRRAAALSGVTSMRPIPWTAWAPVRSYEWDHRLVALILLLITHMSSSEDLLSFRRVRAIGGSHTSKSPSTGAWSDGLVPFRALRSTRSAFRLGRK